VTWPGSAASSVNLVVSRDIVYFCNPAENTLPPFLYPVHNMTPANGCCCIVPRNAWWPNHHHFCPSRIFAPRNPVVNPDQTLGIPAPWLQVPTPNFTCTPAYFVAVSAGLLPEDPLPSLEVVLAAVDSVKASHHPHSFAQSRPVGSGVVARNCRWSRQRLRTRERSAG